MKSCPYQNNPSLHHLPCDYRQNPEQSEIYFCTVCQNYYDVRNLGDRFSGWLLFAITGILLMLVLSSEIYSSPSAPDTSSSPKQSVQSEDYYN